MLVIGRAKHQQGRGKRPAGRDHDVGRIVLDAAVAQHHHALDGPARRVGFQPGHVGAGEQGEVRVRLLRWIDADDLRVGLGVDRAWEAVERVAADARAICGGGAIRVLVQLDAERQVEGVEALALEDIAELLDARLVLDGWKGVGGGGPGLVGVLAALAVDME